MNEQLNSFCDKLCASREAIKKQMYWETDYNTLSIISAFLHVSEKKEVNVEKYKACKKILKNKVSAFSELRGIARGIVLTKMELSDNPEAFIEGTLETYRKLRDLHKFTASPYMVLAAMTIYEKAGAYEVDTYIDKLEYIYSRLKSVHPLLISDSDRAILALIAVSDLSVEQALEKIEANYNAFKSMHFSKDSIHSMAQALSTSEKSPEVLKEEITSLFQGLKNAGKPIDKRYGSVTLSLLTFLNLPRETIISEITDVDNYLKDKSGFKWYNHGPKFRRMFDEMVVMLANNKNNEIMDVAMASSMSYLITIMILIMCSASSSAAAAAAASSGSN